MDFTQIVSNLFHVYYNHSYFCEIINFVRICNIYNQTNQRKKFRKLYLTKQVHYDTFICKKGVEQSEFYFYTPLLYSFYCHISQHFYCVSFQYNNASHPTKMQQLASSNNIWIYPTKSIDKEVFTSQQFFFFPKNWRQLRRYRVSKMELPYSNFITYIKI